MRIKLDKVDLNVEQDPEVKPICVALDELNTNVGDYIKTLTECKPQESSENNLNDISAQELIDILNIFSQQTLELNAVFLYSKGLTDQMLEIVKHYMKRVPVNKRIKDPVAELKLNENWELFKKSAVVLHNILLCDELKKNNKHILNNLKLFKLCIDKRNKLLSSYKKTSDPFIINLSKWQLPEEISEERLVELTKFFSLSLPFIQRIVQEFNTLVENNDLVNMDETIQLIPNIYLKSILSNILKKEEELYFLEAAVCMTIIVDRLIPEGVFHSRSQVDVATLLSLLKNDFESKFGEDKSAKKEALLNQVTHWTLHLKDVTTSERVKKVIGVM